MYNIDLIMNMLDSNNSYEKQQKGISLARNINSINVFMQPANPGNNKNVWENCARILSERSDNILKPYLIQLLEWVEDINWPGALIILGRLKKYSETNALTFAVSHCIKRAVACDDQIWLDYLSELLDNGNLKEKLPKDIIDVLQVHYHNWGFWDKE